MDTFDVGTRIKYFRTLIGMKKGTLATKAGVSPSYIQQLENGEKNPTVATLEYICFALGVSLEDFFHLDPPAKDRIATLTPEQKHILNQFLNSLN